jgi:hypothetical protein
MRCSPPSQLTTHSAEQPHTQPHQLTAVSWPRHQEGDLPRETDQERGWEDRDDEGEEQRQQRSERTRGSACADHPRHNKYSHRGSKHEKVYGRMPLLAHMRTLSSSLCGCLPTTTATHRACWWVGVRSVSPRVLLFLCTLIACAVAGVILWRGELLLLTVLPQVLRTSDPTCTVNSCLDLRRCGQFHVYAPPNLPARERFTCR